MRKVQLQLMSTVSSKKKLMSTVLYIYIYMYNPMEVIARVLEIYNFLITIQGICFFRFQLVCFIYGLDIILCHQVVY